jgi:3-phenylpropionate/trans-cinnamate dioxygenase ferredoxin subunit
MATSTRFVPVARADDVAPGEVIVVEAEGRSLALGRTEDGRFGVIDNVCTHDGGTLGEGELEGDCVECPRHGGRFDVKTGEVTALPPVLPIKTYPVRVEGEEIQVLLEK